MQCMAGVNQTPGADVAADLADLSNAEVSTLFRVQVLSSK